MYVLVWVLLEVRGLCRFCYGSSLIVTGVWFWGVDSMLRVCFLGFPCDLQQLDLYKDRL